MNDQQISFVGTGQMATALAAGFRRTLLSAVQVRGFDPSEPARRRFAEAVGAGVTVTDRLEAAVEGATTIFIAVKPQVVDRVLSELKPLATSAQLIVSVAAGVTLGTLANGLPPGTRLIRVMPNTPCLIGKGACGMCAGSTATDVDTAMVLSLLQTVGHVEVVPERLMDVVTGLSGSGPAFVFQMIQAMSDGAVRAGMPRDLATRLAAQTVAGSGEMVLQLGQHPIVLSDSVASPGGTTIAGLHALAEGGFTAAVMNAVESAARRSGELGG